MFWPRLAEDSVGARAARDLVARLRADENVVPGPAVHGDADAQEVPGCVGARERVGVDHVVAAELERRGEREDEEGRAVAHPVEDGDAVHARRRGTGRRDGERRASREIGEREGQVEADGRGGDCFDDAHILHARAHGEGELLAHRETVAEERARACACDAALIEGDGARDPIALDAHAEDPLRLAHVLGAEAVDQQAS